jgi:glycosyltransferase involved in cell wall biosynthesis
MTRVEPGGTERQMTELIRRLDPDRWRVHLVCFQAKGAWLERVSSRVASVVELGITSFRSRAAASQFLDFARWCRASRIAVVHTTEMYSNTFGLPAAALAGVPVRIGNRREINPDKSTAQIAMQRVGYACAHRIVANCQAGADRLRREGVPRAKIAVVPNGIAISIAHTMRRADWRPRIVVVANLRPEKGHDVLLDAAALVVREFPDIRIDFVGGGTERAALEARTSRLGLGGVVSFRGHIDDVPSALAEADLFVLPSRSEAFPNAVLEAMAAGLPIVATRVGGVPELVDDGRTGLLVPPGSAAELARRLCELLSQPALAARLGQAAQREAKSRYSFDRMVASFESIYLTELTRRGAALASPVLAAS